MRGSNRARYLLVAGLSAFGPLALSACPAPVSLSGGELAGVCGGAIELRTSYSYPQYAYVPMADILFVIDNSASMAEQQARLAAAAPALLDALDAAKVDYRIAFTTTDAGNPTCAAADTTPEHGEFVLSSCRERIEQFSLDLGLGEMLDASALACMDQCTLDADALAISPSTIVSGGEASPRPWMERSGGGSNLPPDTELVEAFRCFAPQGIDGCRFESPLESMYLALSRASTAGEAAYGFMRPAAVWSIVFLSDAVDCSSREEWGEIFDAAGSKVFWSDPEAEQPSAAVCWNAGVACAGDPSGYEGCEATNHNLVGAQTSDANAVLHPLARYVDQLERFEGDLHQYIVDRELVVSVIAGVEGGGADWSVAYADAEDPELHSEFGIGPGCVGSDGPAMPPVRVRALGEAFEPEAFWSVCDEDYAPALSDLSERIVSQFESHHCYVGCVGDADRSTPRLEPSCLLETWAQRPGESSRGAVPECLRDAQGHYLADAQTGYTIPEGHDLCAAMLVDHDGLASGDPLDDISPACAALTNLEFVFARRPGTAAPDLPFVSAQCDNSECREEDCPFLIE